MRLGLLWITLWMESQKGANGATKIYSATHGPLPKASAIAHAPLCPVRFPVWNT